MPYRLDQGGGYALPSGPGGGGVRPTVWRRLRISASRFSSDCSISCCLLLSFRTGSPPSAPVRFFSISCEARPHAEIRPNDHGDSPTCSSDHREPVITEMQAHPCDHGKTPSCSSDHHQIMSCPSDHSQMSACPSDNGRILSQSDTVTPQ